jgi:hypothetical protein
MTRHKLPQSHTDIKTCQAFKKNLEAYKNFYECNRSVKFACLNVIQEVVNCIVCTCTNCTILSCLALQLKLYNYSYRLPVLMSMLLFWKPACTGSLTTVLMLYHVCVGMANK